MTNKDKFREVFGAELCYCGAPEKDGCFYLISHDDYGTPFVLTENKQDTKEWLSAEYHPTKSHGRLAGVVRKEIEDLANSHSVDVPVTYGDGVESTDKMISLEELSRILSEIEDAAGSSEGE